MKSTRKSLLSFAALLLVQICGLGSFCAAFQVVERLPTNHRHRRHFGSVPARSGKSPSSTSLPAFPVATSIAANIALPSCTAANVAGVAVKAGCVGLVSQLLLTKLLQKRNDKNSAYTAHNIVAMALMITVSSMGVVGWWLQPQPESLLAQIPSIRWLGAVIAGMFTFWDIPTSLWVKELRNYDVILHHVVMTVVAWLAATTLPMRYLFFYLGVSELSSLPLICYDQLNLLVSDDDDQSSKFLRNVRDKTQIAAAVSFTWIRALLFTKVTLFNYIPQVSSLLASGMVRSGKVTGVLRFSVVATLGFTMLQLLWFNRMLRVMFQEKKKPPVWMERD